MPHVLASLTPAKFTLLLGPCDEHVGFIELSSISALRMFSIGDM